MCFIHLHNVFIHVISSNLLKLEHVDNRNIIDFIKETHFYNQLLYALFIYILS